MTTKNKRRARQILGIAFFLFAVGLLCVPILMMVGCAAGSTSEITPAESAASEKATRMTAPTTKKSTVTILLRRKGAETVADTSEEK